MNLRILVLFLSFSFSTLNAQSAEGEILARDHAQVLASGDFAGRGYLENGMQKAANYIENQFKKSGLTTINDSLKYRQAFNYPINVLKDVRYLINDKELKFGFDFLVNPSAKNFKQIADREIYTFDSLQLAQLDYDSPDSVSNWLRNLHFSWQTGGDVLLPNYTFKDQVHDEIYQFVPDFFIDIDKGIVKPNFKRVFHRFTDEKLTHVLSTEPSDKLVFTVKKDILPEQINSIDYQVDSQFIPDFKGENIIGKVKGKSSDSLVVISGHYDHLGKVSETIFPGANDNASGISLILRLADYFAKNQPNYDMLFVAFSGEEAGLFGSKYFAENPPVKLEKIAFVLNLDIVGTGDDGIQVVNGKIYPDKFELLQSINQEKNLLKQVKVRGEACNSDHCPFHLKGIPSFFIYTLGGARHYHDPFDSAENLSLKEIEDLEILLRNFVEKGFGN